jgi:hypothetical protein
MDFNGKSLIKVETLQLQQKYKKVENRKNDVFSNLGRKFTLLQLSFEILHLFTDYMPL